MKIILMLLMALSANAYDFAEQTKSELEKLKKNPNLYYKLPATKINPHQIPYARKDEKFALRRQLFDPMGPLKAVIGPYDNVRNLVYNYTEYVKNIREMDAKGLNNGTVEVKPWTGHYWPFYRGVTGNRYNDYEFNRVNNNWINSFNYIKDHPADLVYRSGKEEAINSLAPSEKYDLILNTGLALTKKNWSRGKPYYDRHKYVPIWMGICHGWAPASFIFDRPLKTITVPSAIQGLPIKFYPADIKALAAQVWAYNGVWVNFIGRRCEERTIRVDSNGRVINPDCNDTNPGTFHMALANQIGLVKKPIIMDSSYDHEVWNSPIVSYKFNFFNPYSKTQKSELEDAIVRADQTSRVSRRWRNDEIYFTDRYRRFRAPGTTYIVGISAEIEYQVETVARHYDVDEAGPYDEQTGLGDKTVKVIYLYDLELDSNYNIIGGEWHKNEHPDFLWTPKDKTTSYSDIDEQLAQTEVTWDGQSPFPYIYTQKAIELAEKRGSPLASVVEKLIELSRK